MIDKTCNSVVVLSLYARLILIPLLFLRPDRVVAVFSFWNIVIFVWYLYEMDGVHV
jgi:hypothetical protein